MIIRKSRIITAAVFLAALWLFFVRGRPLGAGGISPFASFSTSRAPGRPARENKFRYIDPLIGTVKGGHVFPGATLPFGMAKPVADVTGENQGGFGYDYSKIQGFSQMHDLGVGWIPSLGNFPIMPFPGCPDDDIDNCLFSKYDRPVNSVNGSVVARPGYFAVDLVSGIGAEMTATEHASLYRFKFGKPVQQNITASPIVVAYLEDLQGSSRQNKIHIDSTTGRMTGNATFSPSFGTGWYIGYVCIDFKGGELRNAALIQSTGKIYVPEEQAEGQYHGARAQFQKTDELLVRVGISFISNEQACRNAEKEVPTFDFEGTLEAAEKAWEEKLSVVSVDPTSADDELLTVFWTGIYRSFISPQNYTGENPMWESDEPYFDSWYCIWDTFRTTHPLLTLLDQKAQTMMVRSLVDIWRHEGRMPDCRMSFSKGYTQGGSNADVVVADALLKGLTEGIDWDAAWAAVFADSDVLPANWLVEGRGGIGYWREIGYIPVDGGIAARSVSRSVEYGYDDFCIAQMAKKLGRVHDAQEYLKRSRNWENLFHEEMTSNIHMNLTDPGYDSGFTGFLQPRLSNGTWGEQDPILCSPIFDFHACYFDTRHSTYEGSIWLYTFLAAPGDMATLIKRLGGRDLFVKRLEFFHESGILDIGDEQSFLTVFMYHYAGRPGLSARRVHEYIPSVFNSSVNGLPGNDDSGAMGAFATFSLMGLFPNAGQDVYLIIPPSFREVSVRNQLTGKVATIRNLNFDPSLKNIYIQKATMNGKPWTKNWLTHRFFLEGGTLELTTGSKESNWGTRKEDLPPSSSTNPEWRIHAT